MEITLALLLYFIRDLEPVTVKEPENARYFLGAQQYWKNEIFQANKLKQNDIVFQKDEDYQYLYVARLSEILEDAESLHADMAILASADRACEEDQLKKIPAGVILVSGKYGVPYVLNRMINIFRFLTEWDKRMHIAALEGKNVQEMLDLSAEILEYPMTVFDSGFNVLAYTSALPTIETHFQTIRNGYTNAYTMSLVRQQRIFSKLEKQPLIVAPAVENPELQNVYMAFAADGNVLGYGYIFPNRTEIEMGYLDLLKIFIANLTFCLQREYEHQRFGQMLYETLLLNLMKPSGISPEQLSEQLKNIEGLEAEGRFALGVLEFEETENVPLPFLARQIARAMWDVRPFLYEDKICMLKIMKTGSRSWNGFSQQEEINLSMCWTITATGLVSAIMSFIRSWNFRQPFIRHRRRWTLAERKGVKICQYTDYYYFDLFASMEAKMPLEHLKMGLYRKLHEYDLQNQTRYCSQILVYLKCDCNATHAAEQMYLHRNTVRKAVQFVEDTWQVELKDTEIKKQMVMGELVDQYLAWKNR